MNEIKSLSENEIKSLSENEIKSLSDRAVSEHVKLDARTSI